LGKRNGDKIRHRRCRPMDWGHLDPLSQRWLIVGNLAVMSIPIHPMVSLWQPPNERNESIDLARRRRADILQMKLFSVYRISRWEAVRRSDERKIARHRAVPGIVPMAM
jgi:hypothetical protein